MYKPTGRPRGRPRKDTKEKIRAVRIRPALVPKIAAFQLERGLVHYSAAINDLIALGIDAAATTTASTKDSPQ